MGSAISLQAHDISYAARGRGKPLPYARLGVHRITSRYHLPRTTDKEPGLQRRERLWTLRHNWAIIGTWKNAVHSAELQ